MKNIITKCKNCGGTILFNPEKKCLKCVNCESNYDIDFVFANDNYHSFFNYSPAKFNEDTNVYVCDACGSIMTAVNGNEVVRCSTCGNTNLTQKTSVNLVPDQFMPFSISKNKAQEAFREWLKKRKFAPNKLKLYAREGKLTGVYVPAWKFIYDYSASYSGYIEEEYEDANGEKHTTRKHVSGYVSDNNCVKNVSASTSIYSIDALGFLGNKAFEYDPSFTYGFSMLKNNIDEKRAFRILESLVERDAWSEANSKEPFARGITIDNLRITNVGIQFIYVPVWVNYYTYKNKNYQCLINGVTGNVIGKYPKSFWKIFGLCAGIAAAILALILIFK